MAVAVPMVTQTGELHGIVDIRTNSCEDTDFKHSSEKDKAELKKQKKEDARIVKMKYFNKKGNHERLTKPYCRYAGDPIVMWNLIPGYIYDLPMGFVKEVQGVKQPKRSGLVSLDGQDLNRDGSPLAKDMIEEGDHVLYPATF